LRTIAIDYRLTLGEAKADTGKGDHKEAFVESGGHGRRFVPLECLN